jgi:hypothetical protein
MSIRSTLGDDDHNPNHNRADFGVSLLNMIIIPQQLRQMKMNWKKQLQNKMVAWPLAQPK